MRMVEVRILPPQPTLTLAEAEPRESPFCDWQPRGGPAPPAAIHGLHVVVTHLLQIVRNQRRAETAAAIQDHFGDGIRYNLLDGALDDAFAEMDGAGDVPVSPFIILAHVHEKEFFSRIGAALDVGNVRLFDLLSRFVDQLQELW